MRQILITFALVGSVAAADHPTSAPPDHATIEGRLRFEQSLYGRYRGGPCLGELTLRPDGTFLRTNYSPGGHRLAGTWQVTWVRGRPRLSLSCVQSDGEHFVGTKQALDDVRANPRELAHSGGEESPPTVYRRLAEPNAAGR